MDTLIERFRENIEMRFKQLERAILVENLYGNHGYLVLPLIATTFINIDTCSYLDNLRDNNGKKFQDWVSKYINLESISSSLLPVDIYQARCGILHSSSAINTDRGKQKNRVFMYYYQGNPKNLSAVEEAILQSDKFDKVIMVSAEKLFTVFLGGLNKWIEEIKGNESKLKLVEDIISTDMLLVSEKLLF